MVGVWLGAGGTVSHFIPLNPVRSRFFLMLDPLSRFQSDRSVGEMGDGAAVDAALREGDSGIRWLR